MAQQQVVLHKVKPGFKVQRQLRTHSCSELSVSVTLAYNGLSPGPERRQQRSNLKYCIACIVTDDKMIGSAGNRPRSAVVESGKRPWFERHHDAFRLAGSKRHPLPATQPERAGSGNSRRLDIDLRHVGPGRVPVLVTSKPT